MHLCTAQGTLKKFKVYVLGIGVIAVCHNATLYGYPNKTDTKKHLKIKKISLYLGHNDQATKGDAYMHLVH